MSARDAAKRLADHVRQSRAEARRWSDAETWQDLCELVAQFCEGDRPRTPNHCGPRDPETVEIGAELANANRQGFLTAGSQPARAGVQNAEVMGFATDGMVEKLRRLVAGTRLVTEVREPRKPFHRRDSDWHVTAGQAEEMFPGWDFSEDKQVRIFDPDDGDSRLLWDRLGQADWDNPAPPEPETPMPRHIPPGREDLWRRQAEIDAEIARLDAACDAAEQKAHELAKVLGPDDSIVEDADEEFARLLDERNRAVAVADAVYRERIAGLTSWIDHDPTAPICPDCQGAGGPPGCDAHGACSTCRGWGREHRELIPVWSDELKAWINPATGRTVDLLADSTTSPTEQAAAPKRAPEPATPTQPTTTPTTGSAGGAMASIEEVRAGIMQGTQSLTDALGMLKQAESEIESGQQSITHAVEGSGQNDAQEALGLLQRALESVAEVVQMVNAAAQSAEDVAARL